jgi:DNA-directed RNA polymerase II subunit RPB1
MHRKAIYMAVVERRRQTAVPVYVPVVPISNVEQNQQIMRKYERDNKLPRYNIDGVSISMYSWEDMKRTSVANIVNTDPRGEGSVNDARMGPIDTDVRCAYCDQIGIGCPGHNGLITFPRPIYNPLLIRPVISVLNCVCNDCGGLLIDADAARELRFTALSAERRLAALECFCKTLRCMRNRSEISNVRQCKLNPHFLATELKETGQVRYYERRLQDGKIIVNKSGKRELLPIVSETGEKSVLQILDGIQDEDALLLGFEPGSHPRDIIMRGLLVIPNIARPPTYENGALMDSDVTRMYLSVLRAVKVLRQTQPVTTKSINELYCAVKQFFMKPDKKKSRPGEVLSITELVQGKFAIMREIVMGKRNNYGGRTVSGPDPSLKYGQIRIPSVWAEILTKSVRVTQLNIEYIRYLLEQSHVTHFTKRGTAIRRLYKPDVRFDLQVGDRVDRWLQNGDRIVINRQPTLRRQSMMAYEVVLGSQLSIGLHLSYTSPMNNDFDGDENNAWDPQDFEVEAEAEVLLNVKNNIMSSEKNTPIMGLIMNGPTATYLLSAPDIILKAETFGILTAMITASADLPTLRDRCINYGLHPLSGRALLSALLPADLTFHRRGKRALHIVDGILIDGRMTKSHVGPGGSLIQEFWKSYGSERTSAFLTDAPWVLNRWLIEHGFTVGMADIVTTKIDDQGNETDPNASLIEQELAKVYLQVAALGPPLTDTFEENHRRRQLKHYLDVALNVGNTVAKDILSQSTRENSIDVMTENKAGTKGAAANIGQIMGIIGGQFYRGELLQPTITGNTRLLPAFERNDLNPLALGFVASSYERGLTVEEQFFLQAGSREGIMDTSLKTSETGTIQRRMEKATENMVVAADGSVRNTVGVMFQPCYNCGYSTSEMISVGSGALPNLTSFIDVATVFEQLNSKRGWAPAEIVNRINENRTRLQRSGDVDLPPAPTNLTIDPVPVRFNFDLPAITEEVLQTDKINIYEKARLIGTRATQLDNDMPVRPNVDIGDELDPVRIALMEYNAGQLLPLHVIRKYADGTTSAVYPDLAHI